MTYISKFTRTTGTITALYTCPEEHGIVECEVERMENGEAPDVIACPVDVHPDRPSPIRGPCGAAAVWTPSPDVSCRVRRVEVVRGRWEKPERNTYLDTRKLGEGQPVEEFQAERKKIWTEQRRKKVKELLR